MVVVFDLDDTLYDEIEFVKSGFKEVCAFLQNEIYFDFMWSEFLKEGSGKIFDKLIQKFNLTISLEKLVEIYRFHFPEINLDADTKILLTHLKKKIKLALITDGHYITQKNKFAALGLEKFIEFPVFTDTLNTKKPDKKPFMYVSDFFCDNKYVYVADNPKKDFFAPKELNWFTIRYKNPKGIYRDIKNNADVEIENLGEVATILDGL